MRRAALARSIPTLPTRNIRLHLRCFTSVMPRMCCPRGSVRSRFGRLRIMARSTRSGANRARMDARAASLPLEFYPVFTEDGSDSTSLDEIVELLAQNGRTVAEAVRMMLPPANLDGRSSFLQYSGDCMEPWTDLRRWPLQTAGRWARFSTGTGCGLVDLRWTTRDWLLPVRGRPGGYGTRLRLCIAGGLVRGR